MGYSSPNIIIQEYNIKENQTVMKRITLFLGSLCVFTTTLLAQITGGFYNQNGYIYFIGQNVSGYGLSNLTIKCVNNELNQQQTFTMDFLSNGNRFSVGPSEDWVWQPGERLIITYANGQSVYWVYQPAPIYNSPYDNSFNNSSNNNMVIREQIRQLESKIRDAERSLRQYEEWNRKDPSISNSQLVNSQRQLIRTYQDRIQQLIRQMQ